MLRLRLTIDARGRVVAVEPVGRADRAFLAAARRHLLAPGATSRRPRTAARSARSTVDHLALRARSLTPPGRGWRTPALPPYLRRHVLVSPACRARAPRFADLRAFMRQRSREQMIGAALAVLVTVDHRHRVLRRFEDQHRAAAADHLCRAMDAPTAPTPRSSPTRRRTRRRGKRRSKERQRQFQKLEKQLGM